MQGVVEEIQIGTGRVERTCERGVRDDRQRQRTGNINGARQGAAYITGRQE